MHFKAIEQGKTLGEWIEDAIEEKIEREERVKSKQKRPVAAGQVPPWKAILDEYWNTKGWINGSPRPDKLAELGLDSLDYKKTTVLGPKEYD